MFSWQTMVTSVLAPEINMLKKVQQDVVVIWKRSGLICLTDKQRPLLNIWVLAIRQLNNTSLFVWFVKLFYCWGGVGGWVGGQVIDIRQGPPLKVSKLQGFWSLYFPTQYMKETFSKHHTVPILFFETVLMKYKD